jgi:hypothetical protein
VPKNPSKKPFQIDHEGHKTTMKATLNTPNTLFLAIWTQADKSILLGTLQTNEGPVPVMEDKGQGPTALLATCLEDAKLIDARHLVIFTNDKTLLALYTPPIRLEPVSAERQHLYVPVQWAVLRHFCRYDTWQVIEKTSLPNAKAKWEAIYAH